MRQQEHTPRQPSVAIGRFVKLALILLALAAIVPMDASAKQARLFAGSFGAASNPAPFPANPYPTSPTAIAVDGSSHDVYVSEASQHRVEKFDSSGHFLFMLGGAVNKTAVEEARSEAEQDLCPAPGHPADSCQGGTPAATPGAFEVPSFLAVDNSSGPSQGDLYVGDAGQSVQEQQAVTVGATGGTFTLTFAGQTTVPIAFNAPVFRVEGPGSIQDALEALSTLGVNLAFQGSSRGSYKLTFEGKFTGLDVPQITCDGAALSGGGHSCEITTLTQGGSTTRVEKFDPSGHVVAGWGEAGRLNGSAVTDPPAQVEGPFVGMDGLTVDPAGHLWLSEGRNQVFEFDQTGSFVSGFDGIKNGQANAGGPLAVDAEGNLYFNERGREARKFDSTGKEIGSIAPSQAEKAEFGQESAFKVESLAVDPSNGDLFLGGGEEGLSSRVGVVRRYDSSCHPIFVLELANDEPGCAPSEIFGAGLFGAGGGERLAPHSLAVDPSSHALYVAQAEDVVAFIFQTVPAVTTTVPADPTHTTAILTGTIDPSGIELNQGLSGCRFEWGETAAYGHTEPCDRSAAEIGKGNALVEVHAAITGLQAGKTYHYRLVASNPNDVNENSDQPSFGEDLGFGPPLIEGVSALSVDATTAVLRPEVNSNDLDTHVRIQYGTEAGAYASSTAMVDAGSAEIVQMPSFQLSGLAPGTVYHYRVVAENVLGEGERTVVGPDQSFVTQGPGAGLPDRRGWELVSPPNKLGANIASIGSGTVQASASGQAITYQANAPIELGPPGSADSRVQVLSARGSASAVWVSRDINTPHGSSSGFGIGLGSEDRFFSTDLSHLLVQPYGPFTPMLSAEASEQTPFLRTNYVGDNPASFCLTSCYRPLVTGMKGFADVPPEIYFGEQRTGAEESFCRPECGPLFLSANPDASHAILTSRFSLVEGAPPGSPYEWADGRLRLISVLPGSSAPAPASSNPTFVNVNSSTGTDANARNAISTDGSRVLWAEGEGGTNSKHHLYLRDVAREETLQVDLVKGGSGRSAASPHFQAASADDSVIYFTDSQMLTPGPGATTETPNLYQCEVVESEGGELECKLTDLSPENAGEAGDVLGVTGVSEDGSYVYFVANGVLTGTEENARHEKALPGSCGRSGESPAATCNLYLRHDGTTSLIAVLSSKDSPDWDSTELEGLTARVSPDGRWLTFMSQRSLTGYDNRDVVNGARDQEVFLHDATQDPGQPALLCASCNSSGARPHGVPYEQLEAGEKGLAFGFVGPGFGHETIAANVPGWVSASYQSRYLSDSGRIFFDSSEALVPRDSNGTGDVYEYEPGGVGDCGESDPTFSVTAGGCVSLISSGTSSTESAFLDASESGDDVFFITRAQLSKRDTDSAFDVYDARVGGGEPEPVKPVECQGAACQAFVEAPNDPTPGSLTFSGPGNLKPAVSTPATGGRSRKRGCAKGKKLSYGRCVKAKGKPKKKATRAKKASVNRRTGR